MEWANHMGIWSVPVHFAIKFDIPLYNSKVIIRDTLLGLKIQEMRDEMKRKTRRFLRDIRILQRRIKEKL